MKGEIIAGLRNSLERGESLEQAKKSFVNAGYNPQEVEAAGEMLSEGVSGVVFSQEVPENSQWREFPPLPDKKRESNKVIIIILIILILAIFFGGGGYLLYRLIG